MANDSRLELLNTKEVAARFNIPANTLKDYRYRGLGPNFLKPGGRVLYDAAEVQRWIESGRHIPSVRAHLEENRAL